LRYLGPKNPRYPAPYPIRTGSIGDIYHKRAVRPEYREHRQPDRYGEFQKGYQEHGDRKFEQSPESRPEHHVRLDSPEQSTSQSEGEKKEPTREELLEHIAQQHYEREKEQDNISHKKKDNWYERLDEGLGHL
jgi:hypothetical protein